MPNKRNKRNHRKERTKKSAFKSAPKQGMGSTEDWIINDIQPLVLPAGTGTSALTIRLSADANGFSWNVSDSGTTLAQYPTAAYFQNYEGYGYANNQFQRLAQLWEQYRVDWIEMEYQPTAASAGFSSTAVISCIDEADLIGGSDGLSSLVSRLSSQRTTDLHTPYTVCRRKLDFSKYLGQGQDRAWLQTIDPAIAPLINREQYVTNLNSGLANTARSPALAMVFGLNVGAFSPTTSTVPLLVGLCRVRCKFSFRQRAALKDDPVLDLNTLVGFDTLKSGQHVSMRIPVAQIQYPPPQRLANPQVEEEKETATSDEPQLLSQSTRSALQSILKM